MSDHKYDYQWLCFDRLATGTRQAFLPGGRRTGAPGKHVVGGKAKYRLVDEKVRVYVAPPLAEIENSVVRPLHFNPLILFSEYPFVLTVKTIRCPWNKAR